MTNRHLSEPHNFICITDDPTGIVDGVIIKPITMANTEGWWHKLSFFSDPLYDLSGPVLTLDLDVVIVDNIDCFFDYPGEFCIIKDYYEQNGWNSSIMKFEAGQHSDILEDFDYKYVEADPKRYWGDQAWITECRPDAMLWPESWVQSYKWQCLDEFKRFSIPQDCKVVLFHGKPDPHEVMHHIGEHWNNK
jgi:hypothetical protein